MKRKKTVRDGKKRASILSKRHWPEMINIVTGVGSSTAGTLVGGAVGGPAGAITGDIVANLLQAGLRKVVCKRPVGPYA